MKKKATQNNRYWQALETRDESYDGKFYCGVLTTGVFCNPSCPSRRPHRRNVRFFSNPKDAELSGLRACKKCNPTGARKGITDVVHVLCRHIETHLDKLISLKYLAKKSGYSEGHIQKAFVAAVGCSPKAYQQGLRREKLKQDLKLAPTVTEAIYEAGYGSSSRVYDKRGHDIGMTPKQYSNGGLGVVIHYASGKTTLGVTMIAATERGICFLQFGEKERPLRAALKAEYPHATIHPISTSGVGHFAEWMNALNRYLTEKKSLKKLPLDIRGTAFQILVWRYLQTIPAGEVRSYRDVAEGIGKPSASRAVASACASNRIALAIPCHRVIRGNGELAGYRWGVERKRALIQHEQKGKK